MSGTRTWRLVIGLVISAVLVIGCGAASDPPPTSTSVPPTALPTPTPISPTPTPTLVGSVDIGGRKLSISCAGEGSPTIIMEADADASGSNAWSVVRNYISGSTRACYYDRAGIGLSDPRPTLPCTTQDMVDDLHALLTSANIPGPYILVAHSLSGLNVRLYAKQYPADVVGMVLVDVVHPDMIDRWLALLPPEAATQGNPLYEFRQILLSNQSGECFCGEKVDVRASFAQVRATGSLDSRPLVVLTRDPDRTPFGPEFAELGEAEWTKMQDELAALSSNSTHTIVDGASQMIPQERPQAVADAILSILAQVRGE